MIDRVKAVIKWRETLHTSNPAYMYGTCGQAQNRELARRANAWWSEQGSKMRVLYEQGRFVPGYVLCSYNEEQE